MDEIARKSCAIFAQTDRDWSAAWSRFSSSAPAGQTGAPTSGACRGPAGPPLGYRLPPGFLRQPAVEPPNDASTWAKRIASAQKPRLDNAGGHPTQASSSVATTTKRLIARTLLPFPTLDGTDRPGFDAIDVQAKTPRMSAPRRARGRASDTGFRPRIRLYPGHFRSPDRTRLPEADRFELQPE